MANKAKDKLSCGLKPKAKTSKKKESKPMEFEENLEITESAETIATVEPENPAEEPVKTESESDEVARLRAELAEVKAELAKEREPKTKRVTFILRQSTYDHLAKMAQAAGRSINDYAGDALDRA